MPESQDELLRKKLDAEIPDGCRDDSKALPQGILHNHSIASESCIDELYRRHHLNMHIHFAWGIRHSGELKTENFCAIFHGLPLGVRNDFVTFLSAGNANSESGWRKLLSCNDQQAVFIENVQLREYPNVSLFRNVVSAVRLTLLDLCQRGGADERLDQFFYPFIEQGFCEIDRKEGFVCGNAGSPVLQGKSIDQVVKCGAQVMNTIADDQRKR